MIYILVAGCFLVSCLMNSKANLEVFRDDTIDKTSTMHKLDDENICLSSIQHHIASFDLEQLKRCYDFENEEEELPPEIPPFTFSTRYMLDIMDSHINSRSLQVTFQRDSSNGNGNSTIENNDESNGNSNESDGSSDESDGSNEKKDDETTSSSTSSVLIADPLFYDFIFRVDNRFFAFSKVSKRWCDLYCEKSCRHAQVTSATSSSLMPYFQDECKDECTSLCTSYYASNWKLVLTTPDKDIWFAKYLLSRRKKVHNKDEI